MVKNKKIIKYYDRIASSGQDPCWDTDCTDLEDFDKGVIYSLVIKKALFKPRQISKFIKKIDNSQKLAGLLLSYVPVGIRSKTLKRYTRLYEKTKPRRDFRYDVFTEYVNKNQKILDVGCGRAPHYARLSEDNKVYGVDISKQMLKRCMLKWKEGKFLNADLKDMPFKSKCFDICSCFGVLILYKNIFDYLKELIRVTKSTIIFDIIDSDQLPYVTPWYLASLCRYYFGRCIEQYQHSISEINRFMQNHNFYLYSERTFTDGISDSNKVLIFRKKLENRY